MLKYLREALPWPSSLCVSAVAGQHGDPAEPKLQMSTSSEPADETDATS